MTYIGVSACVVLHDGKRLGWKIHRGHRDSIGLYLNSRYYCGHRESECEVRTWHGEKWEAAEEWCRGFSRHPDAQGWEP